MNKNFASSDISQELGIDFCDIHFKNPFILASAPPTATGEMMERSAEAGWAGGVTKTLVMDHGWVKNVRPRLASLVAPGKSKKLLAFQNIELVTDRSFDVWLKDIEAIRKKHPDYVVVASIMDDASRPDGWQTMARQCESAGAQMLEINMSCPHGMPEVGMGSAIGQNPELAARVTRWVVEAVGIPVMPKMTPNVTDVALVAQKCIEAGAQAIAGINTVAAIIGVDLKALCPLPNVSGYSTHGGLSGPAVKPIALKAVASMAQSTAAPVSGMGGISTWEDAAEFLLLGASTLQVCSAVMEKGYGIIKSLNRGLAGYLEEMGFESVRDMVGRALPRLTSHEKLPRDNRVVSHIDLEACVRCGRCFVSCRDAGYQAITLLEDKTPVVKAEACTGCSLCAHICPVWDCITIKA